MKGVRQTIACARQHQMPPHYRQHTQSFGNVYIFVSLGAVGMRVAVHREYTLLSMPSKYADTTAAGKTAFRETDLYEAILTPKAYLVNNLVPVLQQIALRAQA